MHSDQTIQHEAAWSADVERFKDLLRAQRGSQAAVGRYLGVNRQTMHRWLRSHRAMPPFVAVALDRLFAGGAAEWASISDAIDPHPQQVHESLDERERERVLSTPLPPFNEPIIVSAAA